jgi:predicted RNase H-like HicB family nuclease
MKTDVHPSDAALAPLVLVRPEPPGSYTAQLVGLPEIAATAATRAEAVEQVRKIVQEWIAARKLVPVQVPQDDSPLKEFACRDANDPLEQEFREDLKRFREEDLERTLREYELEDRACSDSSSTPTT